MAKSLLSALLLAATVFTAGCATLVPAVPKAEPAIGAAWPSQPAVTGTTATADIGWRDFFADPRLQQLLAQSLNNNRDLRVATLNVERTRAQYRIQRADRVPSVGVSGSLTRSGGSAPVSDLYSVNLGVVEYELDLFGRVRNLSEAALQQYFSTEAAQRSAQLSLMAEVANLWLTLAADRELQRIALATLESHETSFRLTERRHELGAVSALDVSQARTVVETVRADTAFYAGRVAQDINALTLLAGSVIDPALLPQTYTAEGIGLGALPAGLPAEVLLRRPDVIAAERQLLAANANIGAARAAFFPSIRLTGSIGTASTELSGLFDSGTDVWSFMPQISLPIFQGGRLRAALGMANADRDIALAQYERAIQSGFREVADALALSQALTDQRLAQEALLEAAARAHELSEARYKGGRDSYLVLLDAQRTLYGARQSLVTTQLAEQANRVTLYKVLGGGWKERSE